MKTVAYSIKPFEKEALIKANGGKHEVTFISDRLTMDTVSFARGKEAILVFTSDDVSAPVIQKLKECGIRYISTRSAGTDNIDLTAAAGLGIQVANIPAYSPESIAEHALTLIMALYRNILPSHQQMMVYDFSLDDLLGTTLQSKTVGVVGFGRTGQALVHILRGIGSKVLVCDVTDVKERVEAEHAEFVSFEDLMKRSDIISFHIPLTEETHHLVDAKSIQKMKDGVVLINVSRGAIFNSQDVYNALQKGKISKIGMDVYEFEHNVFFYDHSRKPIEDHLLKAFIQNSRVLLTPHQAFWTKEAVEAISEATIQNLDNWAAGSLPVAAEERAVPRNR